jgi:integrase/recombinase XerD
MIKTRVYNRIYTEEEYALVNIINKDIIDDFLEEYQQRKMKSTTLGQYSNDLRIIALFAKRFCNNQSFLDLTKRDFRKLSIWLSDDLKMSNARVNRIMSACRSMLSYIEDSDEYSYMTNMAKKVKGLPKERVRTEENDFFISFDQIMKIRQKLLELNELQLCVLHMMMFDSGARRNEVAQVKKFNLLNGNKTNPVVGKRGKIFPLIYMDDTRKLIGQWLDSRGEDNVESLWIVGNSESKREASYDLLYEWVMKIRKIFSELEGKELNIFPHSYRHSRTESMLQGTDTRIIDKSTGLPKKFTLEQVQTFMHHSDPKTTLDYSKDHTEDIIKNMFDL